MDKKKRKVESENRQFQPEWTDLYCFTLPNRVGAVPVCLICHQTVAIVKSSNVKRHYETKHKPFDEKYKIGTAIRKTKLESLLSNYARSMEMINRSMTEQEKCSEASLRISWTLAKHMKPFSDAAMVKECFLEAGNSLFENKREVVDTIRRIPISTTSSTRNTQVLADETHSTLKQSLGATEYFALALDESCDIADTAQLIIFVRYLDKTSEEFVEELLTILPMSGTTTGEDLHTAVMDYFNKDSLDLNKVISITTDGAASMVGSKKGLVQRLSSDPKCNGNLISYHCIIHQSVLCCSLNSNLHSKMQNVMKIVNFIRAKSSLRHRQFKSFLEETNAQFDDLLLHNNVRWLSKGMVLERFFEILEAIKEFLSTSDNEAANDHVGFLLDPENVATIAFLADIFRYLNLLNLKLQGKGKLVCELLSDITSFSKKIELLSEDIKEERLHFPLLKSVCDSDKDTDVTQFSCFINKLNLEFKKRFADFKKIENVVQLLSNSFSLKPNGVWTSEAADVFKSNKAALQMEIIEYQEDSVLKETYTKVPETLAWDKFWIKYVCEKKYPELKRLAMKLCTMFGSTYVCEAAFSRMNFIKNRYRSRLTDEHLNSLIRISCTNLTPNFRQVVQNKKCHFSH